MSIEVLNNLMSEQLREAVAYVSTSKAIYYILGDRKEVLEFMEAFHPITLNEKTIRRFVSTLVDDFVKGERFKHEIPLAALVVALNTFPNEFIDQFLYDLANVGIAEMSISSRVAQECLKKRPQFARNY